MLEAVPKNIFANNFYLQQQNVLLGEVDSSLWREKAQLELEEGTYLLYREGHFSGDFVLEHDGTVVARASICPVTCHCQSGLFCSGSF